MHEVGTRRVIRMQTWAARAAGKRDNAMASYFGRNGDPVKELSDEGGTRSDDFFPYAPTDMCDGFTGATNNRKVAGL
jgi:hypothetical protein